MVKAQGLGMKRLPRKAARSLGPRCIGRQFAAPAIGLVPDQRVPDMAHMHPDLMGPPRLKAALNLCRCAAKGLKDRNAGDRVPPAMKKHRLTLTVGFVPGKLRGDFQCPTRFEADTSDAVQTRIAKIGDAMTKRPIRPSRRMRCKLLGQPVMGRVRLGHDQHAGRVLVDPMHDAGSLLATNSGQRGAKMVQQRIDQGAGGGARGRVDDHARGFVDNDQIIILVQDGERNIFGYCINFDCVFHGDLEYIAFSDFHTRV